VHQCPSCRSDDLVTVRVTMGPEPVNFSHCRACEHRWWTDPAGTPLPLDVVLSRAAA